MPYLLLLVPSDTSYSVSDATNKVLRVTLDGGRGRYRRDQLVTTKLAQVVFDCDVKMYDYLASFIRWHEANAASFNANLMTEEAVIRLHTCNIIPGSVKQTYTGELTRVSMTLEVLSNTSYPEATDQTNLDAVAAYGTWRDAEPHWPT